MLNQPRLESKEVVILLKKTKTELLQSESLDKYRVQLKYFLFLNKGGKSQ